MVNRIFGMSLFVLVFILVYFGMHLYVFLRLGKFLAIKKNWIFYSVLVVLALSFPLMSVLERTIDGKVIQIFYTLSSIWVGIMFFLFCVVLTFDVIGLFFKIDGKLKGFLIIGLALILTLYSLINALSVEVKTIEIPISNLEKEMKIVQLSDIHIGTVHQSSYLKEIVEKTNEINPDMVLITGDLFDGSGAINEEMISSLNDLKSETFFTTGNHEQYEGIDEVMSVLNRTKIRVLRNEVVEYDGIQIAGADNPDGFISGSNTFLDSLKINDSKPSILMYHPPKDLEKANKAGIDLQLSGHAHSGQIIPFSLLVKMFNGYMKGLYEYNGTYLYVSPGTGTWGPPFRLGSKNEITVIKLVNKV